MMKTPVDYRMFYNVHDMLDKLAKLEQQNLALLEALKAVLPVLWNGDPRRQEDDPICIQIREALALVQGGTDE